MNHSIQSTMHAIQQDEPNGRLTLREIPVPRPQANGRRADQPFGSRFVIRLEL
jgi:hypothetical protein